MLKFIEKNLLICFFSGLISMILLSCSLKSDVLVNSCEATKSAYIPHIDEEVVRNHYKAFLEKEDMYAFTATAAYPRGDSRAKYAIGDCTGDNVPELHLSFATNYYIYTYKDAEVVLLRSLAHYPMVTPAKNGAIIVSGRSDDGPDSLHASYRIPPDDDPFAEAGQIEGSIDYYSYLKLDEKGYPIDSQSQHFTRIYQGNRDSDAYIYRANGEECTKSVWEKKVELCLNIQEEESEQMVWEFVFSKEEWDYLDAMEEGNGFSEHEDSEEWIFYKRILSGDFSSLDIEDRSIFYSMYESSLDPSTGRCKWKYILQDFNGDGTKDLFIQYDSDSKNYTSADFSRDNLSRGVGFLSYADGKVDGWSSSGSTGVYFIPLRNGQIIQLENDAVTTSLYLGRISPENKIRHETENEYTLVYVDYSDENSHYNKKWYEELYGQDRVFREGETLHFVQSYKNDHPYEESRELSIEEWTAVKERIGGLLIPDCEWKPASVFLPNRYPINFSQG